VYDQTLLGSDQSVWPQAITVVTMTVNMTVGPHEELRKFEFSKFENHENDEKTLMAGRGQGVSRKLTSG